LNKIPNAALPPNGLATYPKSKLKSYTVSAPSTADLVLQDDTIFLNPKVKAIFSVPNN
jgi:hypothetical protein